MKNNSFAASTYRLNRTCPFRTKSYIPTSRRFSSANFSLPSNPFQNDSTHLPEAERGILRQLFLFKALSWIPETHIFHIGMCPANELVIRGLDTAKACAVGLQVQG